MASEYPIATLIEIGQLSQTLSNIDNENKLLLNSGNLDPRLPISIYQVWKPLSLRYSANPSDPTLRQVGEWLWQLCGPYGNQAYNIIRNIGGGPAVITGPSNQSGVVGFTATFSVSVTSATTPTYQWFQNGLPISGANSSSYLVTNAQLSQSGNTYFVKVTNASGPVISNTATLTVTSTPVAYYYYGTTDYSTQLEASTDDVPYLGTFPFTPGQPLSFTWPSGAATNQYIVVKYPSTESIKTSYANAPLNNGVIPSIAFGSIVTFGGWNYIYSRTGNPFSQNTAAPLIFS